MKADSPRQSLVVVVVAAVVLGVACRSSPYPSPPPTERHPVVDTLHGVTFVDPYRWLEEEQSPETRAWIAAQNAYADSIVGPSPLRARLEERVRALMEPSDFVTPRRAGEYEYFSVRRLGDEVNVIVRRPATADAPAPIDPNAEHEVVVDPHAMRDDGTMSASIEAFSRDGRLMAYRVRDGGEDEVQIRLRDLETGADRPDVLPRGLYSSVAFDRDGTGIFYSRRSRRTGARVYFHRLGSDPADDEILFGDGYGPEQFVGVSQVAEGRYLIYTVQHGWARTDVFVDDRQTPTGPVPLIVDAPARFTPRFIDGTLYLLTNLNAPNNRILAVDLQRPAQEQWREVIPEGPDVMQSFSEIDGKLYVTYVDNVSSRIAVFESDGTPAGDVPVPEHHVASIRGAGEGEAFLTLTSLLTPPTVYRLHLTTGEREVWWRHEVPFDSTGLEMKQVWYTSTDGTRAPMYLVHRRGLTLDGSHPTLLYGYGGFNVSLLPRFDLRAAIWVEEGGVYAMATLRGGGEFGETWHRAGMLENKPQVFDDFISAAEFLVDSGYTNPERLAIRGVSNGGLLVATALTKRPELFRAVFCGFPDLDMVRFYQFTEDNNMPALLEYGNAAIPEQFEVLRTFSPYQNVRVGARYPAVMFTQGDFDTRVPPLQARKMTARLQAASRSGLPVILHYDPRAGHAGGRPFGERVRDTAMELTFLLSQLGVE